VPEIRRPALRIADWLSAAARAGASRRAACSAPAVRLTLGGLHQLTHEEAALLRSLSSPARYSSTSRRCGEQRIDGGRRLTFVAHLHEARSRPPASAVSACSGTRPAHPWPA
jgi:hypothetical protein